MIRLQLPRPVSPPTVNLSRLPAAGLVCAVILLAGVVLAWAQSASSTGDESARRQITHRAREGTEIENQQGLFRVIGDRVAFFAADGNGRMTALENLNLERVARVIADNPQQLQWKVTGTITEYRGTNYLLIRRAILVSR